MIAEPSAAVHVRALDPVEFLERAAFVYPERLAVIDGDAQRTYPEFLARVRRFAAGLQAMGIGNGERVAVLAPNVSIALEAANAVPLAGGVLCALNTRLAPEEIDYILGHCGASVLFYDPELEPLVERLESRIPRVREYETFLAESDPDALAPHRAGEDETISINYTSGTTGKPKGVMYTYRGAYLNALAEVVHANLRPESVYLWTLPMFHCNGWCFPWAVTAVGATHVCLRKVDAPNINRAIREDGVTHFCAAPTVLIALANHPETVAFPRRVIVTTAGAPPSPTTIEQVEGLGAEIHHVYGLTETYGPITECAWHSPDWDVLPAHRRAWLRSRQGVPMVTLGANDVRVVDTELRDVPADGTTHGEIVMRGNNVMKGYYDDPAATARAFAGGWFHSGDIAVRHPDGYIEIVDRSKDVIISGGENISTQQVEKVLLEHDAVLEVAVVAIPDEKWGEVPKAFVTLKPGRTLDAEELRLFARERIAAFKVPKAYEFCDLPKTSTGKIQKYVLREREWTGRTKRVN
ncbi:acyl-CoA synthetase [Vulcanimicrobium alpinum]|uniref:Acyl-CoA synthetase n=1 Tax=Vulcanimicrobium alpinum TaxID=3016050 RepID=A0AAN1XXT9_UNVUL|nr:acyl--CoA ligase family protein [Vulcanimicrobium alpinum]BDE06895.1 acyl-CoA synthetase [Vulcanimicrobium alpinum]